MNRDRFRRLVRRAVADLPRSVRVHVDRVAIVVRREPTAQELRDAGLRPGDELFGLYVGTPLTERESYGMMLPDRIVIYQGPLCRHVPPRELRREVQRTVLHEIAHHFGIDDERLHEIGMG